MQVFLLQLTKLIVNIFYQIGSFFSPKSKFKHRALIVGNYNHISVDQQMMIAQLEKAKIDYRFQFTTEKSKFIFKFFSYLHLSALLPNYKYIVVFDYCFPLYCVPKRKGQKHIQMWHANGSFKKFGLPNFYKKHSNALGKKLYDIVPIHSTYDYIFVSSEKCIPHYMEAFNIFDTSKFIVCNNMILNMLIEEKHISNINSPSNEINVICAPTYNYIDLNNEYEQLKCALIEQAQAQGKTVNFLTLLHPKLSKSSDKIEKLIKANVLITDYSSICFEASGVGCKVAFLRSNNVQDVDVFEEAAKHVYFEPNKLAHDIINNELIENDLTEYISNNEIKQIDTLIDLLSK